jgi:ABC-type multidrug transport system ATPase subunit/pSer/pThr/pTyr-binding forkhead associated (FHA) protein
MESVALKVAANGGEAFLTAGRAYVVGRAPTSDVVVRNGVVSRSHLMIEATGGGWVVRDVSANGTWVDGERVHEVNVHDRVRFRLGRPEGPELTVDVWVPEESEEAVEQTAGLPTLYPHSPERRPAPASPEGAPRTPRPPVPTGPSTTGPSAGGPSSTGSSAGGPSIPDRAPAPHPAPRGPSAGLRELQHERVKVYHVRPGTMSVGRSAGNTIAVADLLVSRRHAELQVGDDGIEIVDVGSANGTFVNGQRVTRQRLGDGDVVAIGHHLFQLRDDTLVESVDSGDASFEAQGLSVWAGSKQLVHDISFRLPARSLLAVVGPSGAGKSTLLGALTGFRPADVGSVRYAGRDLYVDYDELRRRIGYVPQEDLLHQALTVRKALEYGAELRFPPDVTAAERSSRIDEVLAELGLAEHADTRVGKLSGGQRKRTSVAMELLARPSLLFLDEPTSGLDAGLDKSVMTSLRTLADGGRTVVVVTHSVAHLDTCDYVLVLAPEGHVAYFGPPSGALSYFGKDSFSDVFIDLGSAPGEDAGKRFRASRLYVSGAVSAPSARAAPADLPSMRQQPVAAQLSTLLRRAVSVIAADRSYLLIIVVFPFLLGLVPRGIPAPFGLDTLPDRPNFEASKLLLVLVVCVSLMGAANAVREIVKERSIYLRERMIGLSNAAYLGSKVAVLTFITVTQSVILTLVGLLGRIPPDAVALGSPMLEVMLAVAVTGLASAMLGLVISAMVNSSDKTMPLLVLATQAQLVLCGGLVPVVNRLGLEQLSALAPARWGFAALASITNLNVAARTVVTADPRWNHAATTYVSDLLFGLLVALGAAVLCAYLLRRSGPRRVRHRRLRPASPGHTAEGVSGRAAAPGNAGSTRILKTKSRNSQSDTGHRASRTN